MAEQEIKRLENKLDEFIRKTERNDIGLSKDMEYLKKELGEIKNLVTDNYITKTEFEPIRKIVYGLVSLILVGVVTALLALVVK